MSNLTRRLAELEKDQTAPPPSQVVIDWGLDTFFVNGEEMDLEELNRRYPGRRIIRFDWADTGDK